MSTRAAIPLLSTAPASEADASTIHMRSGPERGSQVRARMNEKSAATMKKQKPLSRMFSCPMMAK